MLDKWLIKLGLIDFLTLKLNIPKATFVDRLNNIVDKGDVNYFTGSFDLFSSNKNEYKGQVSLNGFEIKQKRRFFETNSFKPIAKGTFSQVGKILQIDVKIKGFHKMVIPFYIFALLFYMVFISTFFITEPNDTSSFFILPFIILHAAFMFGIPYFMMRRSVSRFKYNLEREFHFIAQRNE